MQVIKNLVEFFRKQKAEEPKPNPHCKMCWGRGKVGYRIDGEIEWGPCHCIEPQEIKPNRRDRRAYMRSLKKKSDRGRR